MVNSCYFNQTNNDLTFRLITYTIFIINDILQHESTPLSISHYYSWTFWRVSPWIYLSFKKDFSSKNKSMRKRFLHFLSRWISPKYIDKYQYFKDENRNTFFLLESAFYLMCITIGTPKRCIYSCLWSVILDAFKSDHDCVSYTSYENKFPITIYALP